MVTQSLAVLGAPAAVVAAIEAAEDGGNVVTEGVWRRVRKLPVERAHGVLAAHASALA